MIEVWRCSNNLLLASYGPLSGSFFLSRKNRNISNVSLLSLSETVSLVDKETPNYTIYGMESCLKLKEGR